MIHNVITNVETDDSVVALTFDDGPHPLYTPRLLSILEEHSAKATFFLVGEAASRHPEIVSMIAKAGHAIGNHAWNHRNLTSIRSRFRRLKQIRACAKVTAPYATRLFRPPYGAQNRQVRLDAAILRYKLILWNVSAQDWTPQNSDEIAQKIIKRAAPGNIFLLHDAIYRSHLAEAETQIDRDPMLDGLNQALAVLKQKLRFVTVTEILKSGRPVCNWPIESMP